MTTDTTFEPLVEDLARARHVRREESEPPAPDAEDPAEIEVIRRPRWQSFLIAIGSLALGSAVVFGVMVGGGALLHHFVAKKHVDIFAAFHNHWVVGVILGIAVLWLLPPYPWAKRTIAPLSPEPATAGGAEDGDAPVVAAQLDVTQPGSVLRLVEDRSAITPPVVDASPSSTT